MKFRTAGMLLAPVFCFMAVASVAYSQSRPFGFHRIPPDLTVPKAITGEPAPGKRVLQALPAYENSEVRHALYLPTDWEKGKTYPVIAEYAGNSSTVKMGASEQGYGISGGKGFLWVCLPFVSEDGQKDKPKWWGDPDKTAAYARAVIKDLSENWGGDPDAVILTGFSRGAIACNLIGLRDDETAKLWRAMAPVSHYDNLRWTQTDPEFKRNTERLRRLGDTPQFVCGEHQKRNKDGKPLKAIRPRKYATFEEAKQQLELVPMTEKEGIKAFILENHPEANVTFCDFPWTSHTGEWILRDTPERRKLRAWVQNVLATPRPKKQSEELQPPVTRGCP